MRIRDWSSDVCSSDLQTPGPPRDEAPAASPLESTHAARGSASRPAARRRSAERRVGKVCVSSCCSRWSPYHLNNKILYSLYLYFIPSSLLFFLFLLFPFTLFFFFLFFLSSFFT